LNWLKDFIPGCDKLICLEPSGEKSMLFRRSFLITFGALLLLSAAFASGYWFRANRETGLNRFPLLNAAFDILENNGLKSVPAHPVLEYGMIRGMLQAYDDPYTIFVEPAQHELESNALQGSFGGIGVSLGRDSQGYYVLFPFADGPAAKAGIQDGDRLLAVDNLAVDPQTSLDQVQSAIRGPSGQSVHLTIARPPDYSPLQVSIRRAQIPEPSVTWHIEPLDEHLGVIAVNIIAASTGNEIQRAVQDLQTRHAAYFVLDLRNNPGGLLSAGVDVARLFLKDGLIMQQQYKGKAVETFRADTPGPLDAIPLVVLVNHNSASAAEIIAGAFKVNQRARIIGTPTFGKDTIQLVFDLQDGSSLHVTSAHWWIPGLDPPLGGNGLQPDIPVSPENENATPDPYIQAAIQAFSSP
jgi:carboxyl-terminal processing protease